MKRLLLLIAIVLGAWIWQQPPSGLIAPALDEVGVAGTAASTRLPAFLPPEAHDTLALIRRGGPYPYRQDGSVFENRERRLPAAPHGTYHEYTVKTPGARDRGARRIVTAGSLPDAYWYTDDHYRSFRRFEVRP